MLNFESQRAAMLSGEVYDDLTRELIEARANAVVLTDEYNKSFGQSSEVREEILRRLLKSVGPGAYFEPVFRCEFGFNISAGHSIWPVLWKPTRSASVINRMTRHALRRRSRSKAHPW